MNFLVKCCLIVLFWVTSNSVTGQTLTDKAAENMLLHQRNNGGWPKLPSGAVDYKKDLSPAQKNALTENKNKPDATIDNAITTSEIRYLVAAYAKTKNKAYLNAAEMGINYLLNAQYPSGGWSQYFPDSSGYRRHITYNDNAMVNVLTLLQDITLSKDSFAVLNPVFSGKAKKAIDKGIKCILDTQVVNKNGKLTVWCAQHDRNTLLPVNARSFELASLSGAESVGIVRFLMSIENPDIRIRTSVKSAVNWFQNSKIEGFRVDLPKDENGKITDRIFVPDSTSAIWARFYSLDDNKPIYVGRNGEIMYKLEDIEKERRIGYSYAGSWAETLLEKQYPKWIKKWENK